ncbi:ABC transporter ATP-binding protein/permease [Nocardia sp. NBC_01377]|uniref:ABC transporter ATP-binding protein n=1 Tax=Nocardia sp. NBC_01377 TaxID=2903595 RepID=UPI003255F855
MRDNRDDPGDPDTGGHWRYLWWLVTCQWRRVLVGAVLACAYMVLLTVPPQLLARAIDGVRDRDSAAVIGFAGALLGTGALLAVVSVLQYRAMTLACADAYRRTVRVLTRAVTRLGPTLHRRIGAGEIVVIGSTDVEQITRTIMIVGPGAAGILGYCAVAVALLCISPALAAVVLLGVPVLMVVMKPLLGRLRRTEDSYRAQQGELTAMVGDIVTGLRVLCGIGGKEVFADRYRTRSATLREEGYRVAAVTSWIGAVALALPTVFVAVVIWSAARMAASGQIGLGEMVAVYGYVATLSVPVSAILHGIDDIGRYPVSARRLLAVLTLRDDIADTGTRHWPEESWELYDPVADLRLPASGMVAVVTANRADVIAVFERFARFTDSAARYGPNPLREIRLEEVRRHIVLVDNDAYLFVGPLREIIAGATEPDDARVLGALRVAAAEDVAAGLPDGLSTVLPDRATTLSGGQRQRLRLARAICAEPDVLLLVDPTSAVDAHTEALVAARIHAARSRRTTVIATTSPTVLERCDMVVHLRDDAPAVVGTHRELIRDRPDYRALVLRETARDAIEREAAR